MYLSIDLFCWCKNTHFFRHAPRAARLNFKIPIYGVAVTARWYLRACCGHCPWGFEGLSGCGLMACQTMKWLSYLSTSFICDLDFARLCRIFALAREARVRFPFLIAPEKSGASSCCGVSFGPNEVCQTASLSFSSGPNELLSVALLQGRLGRVRKLMGRMG